MAATESMLETYPGSFGYDAELLAGTIDTVAECATTCTQCADACLAEEDPAAMVTCIRRNLDCADVCAATARVLARQTHYDGAVTRAQLEACIAACRSCGDECAGHADHMDHCRICADSCRRCEEACRQLLDSTS